MVSLDRLRFQPGVLSQISHELRIPLTGILGMARSLKKTSLTVEQEQYLHIISLSGERILSLAKQLDQILEDKCKLDSEEAILEKDKLLSNIPTNNLKS